MFTLDDLRTVMRESAGVDESVDLDGEIEDVPFSDLGYDSLAVLEMAAQVQNRLGVQIPDEAVEEMTTPGTAVEYVNRQLSAARA
jgi:minimal PKS acyl carrier protein